LRGSSLPASFKPYRRVGIDSDLEQVSIPGAKASRWLCRSESETRPISKSI
jgi:hypothetical protein